MFRGHLSRYRLSLVVAAGLVFSLAGCPPAGPTPPKTFAVGGQVLYKDGKLFAGGLIEFLAQGGQNNALGDVGADGKFTLRTSWQGGMAPGAVPGTYKVKVTPKMGGDQTAPGGALPVPIDVPEPVTVKEEDNTNVIIKLP